MLKPAHAFEDNEYGSLVPMFFLLLRLLLNRWVILGLLGCSFYYLPAETTATLGHVFRWGFGMISGTGSD
ncbi:hypothetical protein [Halocynthiibacter namhaensis]|uniref:hypothetical protein n=1 Tax=Halocynthiibacter namhaensis TaxID=1290553 RepID=UPI000578E408|nr:hypothetical protein [Halocynthiibacter namhaensis]